MVAKCSSGRNGSESLAPSRKLFFVMAIRRCWACTLVVVAGLLAIQSAPVRASDPSLDAERTADIRCVLVGIRLSTVGNATQRSAGTMLALYFLGRLEGRNPGFDVENLVIKNAQVMTESDYKAEAGRCGAALSEKGQQIAKIGTDMSENATKKAN